MNPLSIPNFSSITLATGAKQLVVQLAPEIILSSLESDWWFTL
jgi:hypothetical protein